MTTHRESLQNIYNNLYGGDKLRMSFTTLSEWTNFRTMLYRFKKQQDQGMAAVSDDHVVEQLRTDVKEVPGGGYIVKLWFEQRPEGRTYSFEIVTEDDEGNEILPGLDRYNI